MSVMRARMNTLECSGGVVIWFSKENQRKPKKSINFQRKIKENQCKWWKWLFCQRRAAFFTIFYNFFTNWFYYFLKESLYEITIFTHFVIPGEEQTLLFKKSPRGTKTEKHRFSKENKGNPKKTINFQRKTKEIL